MLSAFCLKFSKSPLYSCCFSEEIFSFFSRVSFTAIAVSTYKTGSQDFLVIQRRSLKRTCNLDVTDVKYMKVGGFTQNIECKDIFYSSPPCGCVENLMFGTCLSNFTRYVCLTRKMTRQAKSVKSDRLSCNSLLMGVLLKKGLSLIIFCQWSCCPFG